MNRVDISIRDISLPPTHEVAIAFGWGLAEAMFFFIVPDVYLTGIALRNRADAVLLCLWSTAGAVMGGVSLWLISHHGHGAALFHAFRWIPGITDEMITETGRSISSSGMSALFAGALKGLPFKLFAVHAGALNVPLVAFMAVSAVARLARFLASTLIAASVATLLRSKPENLRFHLHLFTWIAFYTWYFSVMR